MPNFGSPRAHPAQGHPGSGRAFAASPATHRPARFGLSAQSLAEIPHDQPTANTTSPDSCSFAARMTFEEYLISKKIDSAKFRLAEPDAWNNWRMAFEQMHPNSFTAQKLYLINPTRRKYPLTIAAPTTTEAKPATAKPVIKMKPKIS